MQNNRTTCNPQWIELFLDQRLSDEEQTAFESHLSNCDDCCQRLEARSAREDIWSGVREFLRDQRLPPDGLQSGDSDWTGEDASSSQTTVLKLLAPTDDDRMIGRWGMYEVVGVVGTGGMGVVLKAFDAALNRYVAIKILAPHLGNSGAARKRFSREAQAAAAVVHDNVIEIYGVAENAGLPYLVMPYVRGPSLQRRLDDQGPMKLVEILRVGMQAARGLAAAHAQGLVHRDVKPANILLADGIERVKLTDFGLARAADDASLTKTGVIAGTPQYMSPEQARGEPVDPRSDLFSLGSVLYTMCTGRPPFRAETSYGVLRRITDEEPRPIREINPDIPDWLCGIVSKLMAKRAEDRFQSAEEVAKLLEECLAHVQQPAVVPLPKYSPLPLGEGQGVRAVAAAHKPQPFTAWSGPNRILAALGLLVLGFILAFGIIIHLKKDGKTTTLEVPEGSTARVDAQGAVTVELPLSGGEQKPDTEKAAGADKLSGTVSESGPGTSSTPLRTEIRRLRRFDPGMRVGVIALSPDGKLAAVGNDQPAMIMMQSGPARVADNWQPAVKIVDAETGKSVVSLQLTTKEEDALFAALPHFTHFEVTALAFSPDGEVLAVGTNAGQVKLFKAQTGELVRSLDDEPAKTAEKNVPQPRKTLRRAMGSVASLAFSPDGALLAVCGASFDDGGTTRILTTGPGRLKIWDVKNGALNDDLAGHSRATAVAFPPDGHLLASAGEWMTTGPSLEHGTGVIFWELGTGSANRAGTKLGAMTTSVNGWTRSVAFSPDGMSVAVGAQHFTRGGEQDSGRVSLARVASGAVDWFQAVPLWATFVAFSPDGKRIVVLCGGKAVRLLDAGSGELRSEIEIPDFLNARGRYPVLSVATKADLLVIGGVTKDKQGRVEVWSFKAGAGTGTGAEEVPGTITRPVHAANSPQTPTFGPVIERTINDARDNPKDSAIDLDSGKLFSDDSKKTRVALQKTFISTADIADTWVQANGIDAVGVIDDNRGGTVTGTLGGMDLFAIWTRAADWDEITPAEVESRLPRPRLNTAGGIRCGLRPRTCLHQTSFPRRSCRLRSCSKPARAARASCRSSASRKSLRP